jgi:protein SCO1/2
MGNLNRRRAIGAPPFAMMAVVCRAPPAKGSPPTAFLRAQANDHWAFQCALARVRAFASMSATGPEQTLRAADERGLGPQPETSSGASELPSSKSICSSMISPGVRSQRFWQAIATMVALLGSVLAASARPPPDEYRNVSALLLSDAAIPSSAAVHDESGQRRQIADLITLPTVLVFADYTCRTLCGPTVAFVSSALEQSGLRPNEQFRLLVISINPKDRAADAVRMRHDHIGDSTIAAAADFVTADQSAIEAMTSPLGYRYSFDAEADQYVHPAAAYVLLADGKVSRVLTGVGLSGDDMRLALIEASEGRAGTFGDQVRLLCSAFDPARGTYNLVISRALAGSAMISLVLLGGVIGILVLTERRAA